MRDSLRHFAAELIGTFALVFMGGAAIMGTAISGSQAGLLEIALAHGLVIAIMVTALMRISGHFNPAVTLGFLAVRRIDPMMAGVYIVAQLLGAMIGAYMLKSVFPEPIFVAARGGGQFISLDITGTQAFIAEMVVTFLFVLVVFGTAVDPKAPRVGGLAIGFAITAGILAIGPITGGSMNPARSFGPAVASGVYEGQIIYWTAPILGGILAALLYEHLFLRGGPEPVDHGTVRPA
ncbi:MAG: aquaporin [Gemmatimonadaceae bacterium]